MSQQNVVPFEGRRAIDRRGSPDKSLSCNLFELDCPDCGAPLSLEGGLRVRHEALCEECGSVLDVADAGNRTAGARSGD